MAQLYEPYVYKPVDNFDLSLNITEFNPYYSAAYMSVDQTFHTPSFGDEEFDISALHIPLNTVANPVQQSQTYNTEENRRHQQQEQQVMGEASIIPPNNSPASGMMEHVQTQYPGHGAPEMYSNQVTSPNSTQLIHAYNIQQQSYVTSPSMEHQQQDIQCLSPANTQPHLVPIGMQQQPPVLTTISQSQLSGQLGLQIGMSMGRNTTVTNSPPGSNHTSPGLETSEDSDDSTQVNQMTGNVKRQESSDHSLLLRTMAMPKKPKPQKKKKKKDPNEPQKPVSAYALFFRDRQAAIKGQNPNASFGEVSKIVASMWDSLDAEHKGGYKRKTEAAKKEYLKALAAYRASLVSKTADQLETGFTSVTSPVSNSSSSPSSSPEMIQCISPVQKKSPPMSSSPTMTNLNAVSPTQTSVANKVWAMSINNSPNMVQQGSPIMQTSAMDHSPPSITHQVSTSNLISQSHMTHSPPPPTTNQSGLSPSYGHIIHSVSPSPPHMPPTTSVSQLPISHSPLQTCLRQGCTNPPIDSPDWDREYCSSECVVSHCRDVFTAWVASRQTTNSYAVK